MSEFVVNPDAILKAVRETNKYKDYAGLVAQRILDTAKAIYLSQSKGEDKPPYIYINNFSLDWESSTLTWKVINDDPIWAYVEYGAHAGGKTEVLKYRPLGRALDTVAGEHHL